MSHPPKLPWARQLKVPNKQVSSAAVKLPAAVELLANILQGHW